MTNDSAIVKKVRRWFKDRLSEPVTPKWLAHCKSVYKPPRRPGGPRKPGRKSPPRGSARRVWLLDVKTREDFPETERRIYETAEHQAEEQLGNRRRYEVGSTRLPGSNLLIDKVTRGDLVIEVMDYAKVHPHARVLTIRRGKVAGRSVAYIAMECPKDFRTLPWRTFRKECASVGLKLGKRVTSWEIRNVLMQNRVLSLVSPDKLAK